MAITYNVASTGNKFGVYVRALSGSALEALRYKMPELTGNEKGAIAVLSGRIARKNTITAANKVVSRLQVLPEQDQIEIIRGLSLRSIEKHHKLAKLQYFKLSRKFLSDYVIPFTTQNKVHAENVALSYAERGAPAVLHKTVGRNVKLTHKQYDKAVAIGELKPEIPQGLTGMCKPIKEQADQFFRRISQKRKATTRNSFWNKYR